MMNLIMVTIDGVPNFINAAHIINIYPATDEGVTAKAVIVLVNGRSLYIDQAVSMLIASITGQPITQPPLYG